MSSGHPLTDSVSATSHPAPHAFPSLSANRHCKITKDRIPWLINIRHTAQRLTSPSGVAACKLADSNKPALLLGTSISSDLKDALSQVHVSSNPGNGDDQVEKRSAVVIGCSALKRTYRDLLRGKPVKEFGVEEDSEDSLETYFIYR